jgi:hypothetical protein
MYLEVKSIQTSMWETHGRMITPKQLSKYVRNRAVVIWASTTHWEHDDKVTLHGWNHAKEVSDLGIRKKTICDNIWLRDEQHMHPMDEIFEIFSP